MIVFNNAVYESTLDTVDYIAIRILYEIISLFIILSDQIIGFKIRSILALLCKDACNLQILVY